MSRHALPDGMRTPYPNIAQACLTIALDNGGINRGRSIEKWAKEFGRFISTRDGPLSEIEAWMKGLPDEDFETACCGEHTEMQAVLASAPPFTDDLLNDYFDEVC